MADMIITVATRVLKEDKNGKKFTLISDTNGKEWSIFAESDQGKLIPGAGLKISFQTEVNGEFLNIARGSIKVLSYMKPAINKFNPEEMKTRSAALSYCKDLAIADKLPLGQILITAAEFYAWLSEEKPNA